MRELPPSDAELSRVRRILTAERQGEGAPGVAAAAARVYDHLHLYLDPLLGVRGVRLLLLRTAKLAAAPSRCLEDPDALDSAVKLRACLEGEEPAAAEEAAVRFFATFFALLTGFIGERLVSEVLRHSWPHLDASEPPENAE